MKRTRGYVIAVHIICWIFFLSLPALFFVGQGNRHLPTIFSLRGWIYFLAFPVIFYLHTHYLFPRLYLAKRYFHYSLSILLLATAIFFLKPFDHLLHNGHREVHKIESDEAGTTATANASGNGVVASHKEEEHGRPKLDIVSFVLFLLIISLSVLITIIKR